jgi:hypothetical protein
VRALNLEPRFYNKWVDHFHSPAAFPQRVWDAFGSWLRTIRPGIPPSELVVANAMRQSMPEFLLNSAAGNSVAKFVSERQDTNKMEPFRLAS